jgi:hypothetical protein
MPRQMSAEILSRIARLRTGLSQISGVDGSLGMAANFAPPLSGAAYDPESDCREAEASVQGRLVG